MQPRHPDHWPGERDWREERDRPGARDRPGSRAWGATRDWGGTRDDAGPARRIALALLPLRAFLGFTFCFAGLQKLANPDFFDASNRPRSRRSWPRRRAAARYTG
jgi:hypothetical protein